MDDVWRMNEWLDVTEYFENRLQKLAESKVK